MATAIGLRDDFDGSALRRLARGTKDGPQARRLLALAEIYDGGSRADAARIGGVTLQSVRDWVLRFGAEFGHCRPSVFHVDTSCHVQLPTLNIIRSLGTQNWIMGEIAIRAHE